MISKNSTSEDWVVEVKKRSRTTADRFRQLVSWSLSIFLVIVAILNLPVSDADKFHDTINIDAWLNFGFLLIVTIVSMPPLSEYLIQFKQMDIAPRRKYFRKTLDIIDELRRQGVFNRDQGVQLNQIASRHLSPLASKETTVKDPDARLVRACHEIVGQIRVWGL